MHILRFSSSHIGDHSPYKLAYGIQPPDLSNSTSNPIRGLSHSYSEYAAILKKDIRLYLHYLIRFLSMQRTTFPISWSSDVISHPHNVQMICMSITVMPMFHILPGYPTNNGVLTALYNFMNNLVSGL